MTIPTKSRIFFEQFAAQVNIGNVKMLRGDWNKALVDELRNFPNGKHDDQVDGCSDGFNELNEAPQVTHIDLPMFGF